MAAENNKWVKISFERAMLRVQHGLAVGTSYLDEQQEIFKPVVSGTGLNADLIQYDEPEHGQVLVSWTDQWWSPVGSTLTELAKARQAKCSRWIKADVGEALEALSEQMIVQIRHSGTAMWVDVYVTNTGQVVRKVDFTPIYLWTNTQYRYSAIEQPVTKLIDHNEAMTAITEDKRVFTRADADDQWLEVQLNVHNVVLDKSNRKPVLMCTSRQWQLGSEFEADDAGQ